MDTPRRSSCSRRWCWWGSPPPPGPESPKVDGAELAKELQNPVATLIGMPL